ncbi:hypothetical protein PABG_06427 [Paracoccidioides brasiliensis Pb03]|uniref:Hydrophobin n=3 Tax=Paracoccidioides TaxID=38946 RepID=C1GL91_PARBD|nr:hypothetical protein PAAG_00250 [Paracoccidioides lutzii Pb01]XP_010763320.1 uncharacterized protein PADG_07877 [Paracoccidioides brasiliensis Pb18]EEH16340.1 hypothetical protein PABG_06427 [Paracoccidioides brasiliensis Pb03]ODH28008.1 hypothetical protein ACO22_04027 [Paracoccidioides brasiliensis]EEH35927.1 hypothetical protein PAAG_00250 [Paracoccidioides lutzii Pb01]EEH43057.1 hypothetical protein PADG_07877 [Paracoccidioides brasiliensis Pb18]ODH50153.1 hypothetical protein GX48_037
MKFISSSIFLSLLMLLSQSIAIPTPDPEPIPEDAMLEIEAVLAARGLKLPNIPGLCPPPSSAPVQQSNQCSTGTPFCCSTEDGSHNCVKSNVSCDQTVICCNNNFGSQVCMGDIDFNMPINININL